MRAGRLGDAGTGEIEGDAVLAVGGAGGGSRLGTAGELSAAGGHLRARHFGGAWGERRPGRAIGLGDRGGPGLRRNGAGQFELLPGQRARAQQARNSKQDRSAICLKSARSPSKSAYARLLRIRPFKRTPVTDLNFPTKHLGDRSTVEAAAVWRRNDGPSLFSFEQAPSMLISGLPLCHNSTFAE